MVRIQDSQSWHRGSIPLPSTRKHTAVLNVKFFTKTEELKMFPAYGKVPEWLKGADCKSAGFGLREFESLPSHLRFGEI